MPRPKNEPIQSLVTEPKKLDDTEESVWNLKAENARLMKVQKLALEGRKVMRETLKPFCEQCLMADYNLASEDLLSGRYVKDKRISLPKLNLSDYQGEDKFKKVNEHVTRSRDGIRLEIVRSVQ